MFDPTKKNPPGATEQCLSGPEVYFREYVTDKSGSDIKSSVTELTTVKNVPASSRVRVVFWDNKLDNVNVLVSKIKSS